MLDFFQYFELIIAYTPALIEEAHRIRYRVYCEELQYERKEEHQHGMEKDRYDAHSLHCLIRHRRSGVYAGCNRLILPSGHGAPFPFEQVLHEHFGSEHISLPPGFPPRSQWVEISRLAVTSPFRKRTAPLVNDGPNDTFLCSAEERHAAQLLPTVLYIAAANLIYELNMQGIFTVMEPCLARHIGRTGVMFRQLSPVVEYHGQRALFFTTVETVAQELQNKGLPDEIYTFISSIGHQIHRDMLIHPLAAFLPRELAGIGSLHMKTIRFADLMKSFAEKAVLA